MLNIEEKKNKNRQDKQIGREKWRRRENAPQIIT